MMMGFNMIKNTLLIFAMSLALISCSLEESNTAEPDRVVNEVAMTPEVEPESADVGAGEGSISKLELDGVTIHSYTAPDDSELVNSHIIETAKALVIVDMQFFRPYAQQFRAYADSLDKPITRVILTHHHPDHWFGHESFTDVPLFARKEVVELLKLRADFYIKVRGAQLGALVPETSRVPENAIELDSEIIDGLTYEYEIINKAEAGVQTLIKLPDQGVMIAGDLLSNNSHAFYGVGLTKPWIENLKNIAMNNQAEHILVGHGFPPVADSDVFTRQISYLEIILEALQESSPEETMKVITAKYPNLAAEGMADLSANFYHSNVKPQLEQQIQQMEPDS